VRSIQGYLGFLLIGTDLGIRFATLDGQGNIAGLGDLISIPNPVKCFEPQDRFVWFGWGNYDANSTGLGRVDLRTFNGTAPSYASDLMTLDANGASVQGTVSSVVTHNNERVFAVSGNGVWAQSTDVVPTGSITSGYITYGLGDPKTAVKLTTRHALGAGAYTASISTDYKTTDPIGATVYPTATTGGGATIACPSNARGEVFELTFNLYRYLADAESTPKITRWTLRADAGASRRLEISLPLRLAERMVCRNNTHELYDVSFERQKIESLVNSRKIVSFQEGTATRSVIVEDFKWQAYNRGDSSHPDWQGTMLLSLKTV